MRWCFPFGTIDECISQNHLPAFNFWLPHLGRFPQGILGDSSVGAMALRENNDLRGTNASRDDEFTGVPLLLKRVRHVNFHDFNLGTELYFGLRRLHL